MTYNNCGPSAIKYAKFGYPVFPCAPMSKAPITPDGFLDATSDVNTIYNWWKRSPTANVAISIPDNIVILDIEDIEKPELRTIVDNIPDTVCVQTPRSMYSRHYWFSIEPGTIKSRGIKKLPDLDILINGYILAPPSVHPNGGVYKWLASPITTPIAPAPQWLIDLSNSGDELDTDSGGRVDTAEILNGIKEGSRQTALFRFACSLRGRNIRYAEALALMNLAAYNAIPPYNEQPVVGILSRVYKKYPPNLEREKNIRKIWKLSELLEAPLESMQWYCEKILPQGYVHFPSDPKMGKSMFCGNLCLAIARGSKAFGEFNTNKSGILYLDLEQGEETGRGRWTRILGDTIPPDNLHVAYTWDRLDHGGLDEISNYLDIHDDIGVVVIDILATFEPTKPLVEGNAYKQDYAFTSKLAQLAREYKIAIIGIHHNSKDNGDKDFIKRGSGSMGYTAAADVIWSLERTRGSQESILHVTGKNIPENDFKFISTNEGHTWFSIN